MSHRTKPIPAETIEQANALFQEAEDLAAQAADDMHGAARLQAAGDAKLEAATAKRIEATALMCPTKLAAPSLAGPCPCPCC